MVGACGEYGLAVLAFVMRYAVRTKLVSRITIRILLLLGPMYIVSNQLGHVVNQQHHVRVSWTVSAADMSALVARLVAGKEKSLALVASPAHSLTRLLVNQVLTSGLAGSSENNLLFVAAVRVIGNDGSVLFVGLDDGSSSLAAGDNLRFGSLGRVASALGATGMLAVGTLPG